MSKLASCVCLFCWGHCWLSKPGLEGEKEVASCVCLFCCSGLGSLLAVKASFGVRKEVEVTGWFLISWSRWMSSALSQRVILRATRWPSGSCLKAWMPHTAEICDTTFTESSNSSKPPPGTQLRIWPQSPCPQMVKGCSESSHLLQQIHHQESMQHEDWTKLECFDLRKLWRGMPVLSQVKKNLLTLAYIGTFTYQFLSSLVWW